eukprot:GEZU01005763.1.p1 GENE.GEZU01005763.1~~GEZU01005763.1.p1  ORF type:complete len:105 (+),score=16.31 GEZU01005763.1:149-463(+)
MLMRLLSHHATNNNNNYRTEDDNNNNATLTPNDDENAIERNLVVMDGNERNDWCEMFKDCVLPDGSRIRVVQCSWIETQITVYPDTGPWHPFARAMARLSDPHG